MRILVVDTSAELRESCARKLETLTKADKEILDLKMRLIGHDEVPERIYDADVMLIGAGLTSEAISIARAVRKRAAWLRIIMFVNNEDYGDSVFRSAHAAGVRKVFPDSASSLDVFQELMAIHSDFRKEGRTFEGRVVVIVHGKGGVGATSVAAALGEVCSAFERRTLLWDLDVETRDLSRCLAAAGPEAKIVSGWVNGSREVTRETLRDALIPIASDVSVLTAPDSFADAMDLVCHTDGMELAQRIVQLAKMLFDVVIVDTAGRIGPAVGGLVRHADSVLMVSDDSELGLTATDLLLSSIKPLIRGTERIRFLIRAISDEPIDIEQISADLESMHKLNEVCWSLPTIPLDPKVAAWPGSGNTLYSAGNKDLTRVFKEIASRLCLLGGDSSESGQSDSADRVQNATTGRRRLLQRLFG